MLSKIKSGKIQRAQKVFLYGVEKIGKSSLAARFPMPLFLDVERGTHQLDVDRLDIETADELDRALAEVAKNDHDYKTLVIDSVDWAEKLLADKVCAKNKWESIEEPGYGKGFSILGEEFAKFLFSLDPVIRAGINVVLVGHAQIKRFNPPETSDGYDRWELKLAPKDSLKAKEWADAILFAAFDTKVVDNNGRTKGIGGRERVIYTTHSAAYDAGNRHGLPEKIKMDIEALEPLLQATEPDEPPFLSPEELLEGMYGDLDREKLTSFLLERKQIQPGQSVFDVSAEYIRRIAKSPALFRAAVEEFVSRTDKTEEPQPAEVAT